MTIVLSPTVHKIVYQLVLAYGRDEARLARHEYMRYGAPKACANRVGICRKVVTIVRVGN